MSTSLAADLEKLKVGAPIVYDMVGCGAIAEQAHIPVIRFLRANVGATLRGCFDTNPAAARSMAEKNGAVVWGGPEDLGLIQGVTMAIIATPPESHARMALPYLDRGCAVLVEKPFAPSASDAGRLVDAARRHGGAVFVGQMRRFWGVIQEARRFVSSGALGRITRVDASEGVRYFWRSSSTYVVDSPLGGVVLDTGAHVLDAVLFILGIDAEGSPFRILHLRKQSREEPSHACAAELALESRTQGDLRVFLRLSRLEQLPRGIRIYGQNGTLLVPFDQDAHPMFVTRTDTFQVAHRGPEAVPAPGLSVMLAAHLDAHLSRMGSGESLLRGDRFLQQIRILEALTAAGDTP